MHPSSNCPVHAIHSDSSQSLSLPFIRIHLNPCPSPSFEFISIPLPHLHSDSSQSLSLTIIRIHLNPSPMISPMIFFIRKPVLTLRQYRRAHKRVCKARLRIHNDYSVCHREQRSRGVTLLTPVDAGGRPRWIQMNYE